AYPDPTRYTLVREEPLCNTARSHRRSSRTGTTATAGDAQPATRRRQEQRRKGVLQSAVKVGWGGARRLGGVTDDPYAWLEDVEGTEALAWVRERNGEKAAELAATPSFAATKQRIRAILDSDEKIPDVTRRGDHLYNFWKDAEHERGIWRRTTLDSYRTDDPDWETVLDLDALN